MLLLLSFVCMNTSYNDGTDPNPLPCVLPSFFIPRTWETSNQSNGPRCLLQSNCSKLNWDPDMVTGFWRWKVLVPSFVIRCPRPWVYSLAIPPLRTTQMQVRHGCYETTCSAICGAMVRWVASRKLKTMPIPLSVHITIEFMCRTVYSTSTSSGSRSFLFI